MLKVYKQTSLYTAKAVTPTPTTQNTAYEIVVESDRFIRSPTPANILSISKPNKVLSYMTSELSFAILYGETERIIDIISALSPFELNIVKDLYAQTYDRSLRQELNTVMPWDDLRTTLRIIDDAEAVCLRNYNQPLHDLDSDATGFKWPASDGRLPQTINKILQFRTNGISTDADLINHHEITNNNNIELLVNGKKAYGALFNALKNARDSIHVSYFSFHNDDTGNSMANLLIEKAKMGLRVRVMVDSVGSRLYTETEAEDIFTRMEQAGVEVLRIPTLTLRWYDSTSLTPPDHRKIVVIDGKIGFTGGMNIGDTYANTWHDLMVRVTGSAVTQMQVEWVESWLKRGGKIDENASNYDVIRRYFPTPLCLGNKRIKVAQGLPWQNDEIRRTYLQLISEAKESVYISSPYTSMPEIFNALIEAKNRGVKVVFFTPEHNDSKLCSVLIRSWYPSMLAAGVLIYEYPEFAHHKTLLVDDSKVSLGSSNLDGLSLYRIHEMNLNVDDIEFAQTVKNELFEKDIKVSKNITLNDTSLWQWLGGIVVSPLRSFM